jgi:NAD+ synthase (glutamine-hydrolysing)
MKYYDGSATVNVNGKVVAQGSQFSLKDVEVVAATVGLDDVRSFRSPKSRALQATKQPAHERVGVDMSLWVDAEDVDPRVCPSRD